MARTKGAKNKKLKLYKGVGQALRYMRKSGRTVGGFNPQPVFTETFRLGSEDPLRPLYQLDANGGGVLRVRIDQMPQIAQYRALYTKYRIIKAKFICLPQFVTQNSDVNAAIFNSTVPSDGIGMGRIVTVVNNSPQQINPINEDDVLEDNGCLIHTAKPKIVVSCKPVPELLDANGVVLTQRMKFINFNGPASPDVYHNGIRWWYTLPSLAATSRNIPYYVYCKLTFQLADPR